MRNVFALAKGKMTRQQAILLIAFTAFLWSTSGLFIKLLPYNPIVISSLRAAVVLPVLLIYRRGNPVKWTRANVIAGITVTFTIIFFVMANKLTTSANAIVLQYTSPVFTMLYSFLVFKTPIRRKDIMAVVITLGGISLFFFENLSPGNLLGNILAILSGMCFAWLHIHCAKSEGDSLDGIILGQYFLIALGLPFIFFLAPPALTPSTVAIFLYMGILQMGLPYIFFATAMRSATPLDGALITMIEPLFNPVWVFLIMNESPGIMALCGAVIVIFTVGLWCASDAKKLPAPDEVPV